MGIFLNLYNIYMKKLIILITSALFISVILYYLYGEKDLIVSKPTSGQGIIFFGDSLVSGVGASSGKDLPTILGNLINQPVINAGVPGDTTLTAKTRFKNDVLDKNPRIVIILLGGNDFLARIPKNTTITNLREMVNQARAQGAGVVLVGVRHVIYSSDYRNIAEESGAAYVPNVLDKTFGNKELMSDIIHPNDKGYEIIADVIAPAVRELL